MQISSTVSERVPPGGPITTKYKVTFHKLHSLPSIQSAKIATLLHRYLQETAEDTPLHQAFYFQEFTNIIKSALYKYILFTEGAETLLYLYIFATLLKFFHSFLKNTFSDL